MKEFMPDESNIGKALGRVARLAMMYMDKELAVYGMGHGGFPVVRCLYGCDGLRQQDICQAIKVDKSTITRTVNNLVKLGYVAKRRDPSDGRAYMLFLTPKAKKLRPGFFKVLQRFTDILTDGFAVREKKLAMDLLVRMRRNMLKFHGIPEDEEFFFHAKGIKR